MRRSTLPTSRRSSWPSARCLACSTFLLKRSPTSGSVTFERTCVLFSAASGCQRRLQAVHDALAPLLTRNRAVRLWSRVTWPLAREETVENVQAIHRFAQVFHLATTIEGL